MMRADDPRHGTPRGYRAHRQAGTDACEPCKRAGAANTARLALLRDRGYSSRLSPIGIQRRMQALAALGYTWRAINAELGSKNQAWKWARGPIAYVFPPTALKVREVYDRMSMTFPPENTRAEKQAASRARNLARKHGWPPPLAWDNIDDPDEIPTGWQRETPRGGGWCAPDRHAQVDELLDLGCTLADACRSLGVTAVSLEKWCDRNGRRQDFNRLLARERGAA